MNEQELKWIGGTTVVALKTMKPVSGSTIIKEGYVDKIYNAGTSSTNNGKWVFIFQKLGTSTYFNATTSTFRVATDKEIQRYAKEGPFFTTNVMDDIKEGIDKLEKILK